jgi:hypothetical protein
MSVAWKLIADRTGLQFSTDFVQSTGELISDKLPALGTSIHNLVRLQLIATELTAHYGITMQILEMTPAQLTAFGYIFVRACHLSPTST